MKAYFVRKANTIDDLKGYENEKATPFAIEEVVYLEPDEYRNFSSNFIDDQDRKSVV